jgi:hypothetical protein
MYISDEIIALIYRYNGMGILVDRVHVQVGRSFIQKDALECIERVVARRAPQVLANLETGMAQVTARDLVPVRRPGPLKILEIKDINVPTQGFVFKYAQRGLEVQIARRAGELGCGPEVFATYGTGARAGILEDFYPWRDNFNAKLRAHDMERWGEILAWHLLSQIDWKHSRLLDHDDENEDHVYTIDTPQGESVRLIDWGEGNFLEFTELPNWLRQRSRVLREFLWLDIYIDEFMHELVRMQQVDRRLKAIDFVAKVEMEEGFFS